MKKQSLLIIGAGAAGLMAAAELSLYFDVTILEAENRIGGRIHTLALGGDMIEAGAEFVHGNLPVTLGLLKKANIPYEATRGKMYRKKNRGFVQEDEMIAGWDELMQKMKLVKKDITLDGFLQKYYAGASQESFRNQVIGYAEGFDLATPATVSIRSLYKEWSGEDETSYRLPQGYTSLLGYLQKLAAADGCNTLLDKTVNKVMWKQQNILVHTTSGEMFESNKLLVTIPPTLLHGTTVKTGIQFNPSINAYIKAAGDIGMGAVIKAVIKFKACFWEKDGGFFFSGEKFFPTWWTQLPNDIPLLTGWMGGPTAASLAGDTKETILEKAITSLAAIFNKTSQEIEAGIVYAEIFNWQVDHAASGAYSFDTIYSTDAREVLNTPLFKTMFFAGEALYNGTHPGTVEAALASGLHAAAQIKNSL